MRIRENTCLGDEISYLGLCQLLAIFRLLVLSSHCHYNIWIGTFFLAHPEDSTTILGDEVLAIENGKINFDAND